jgi:hypothetical protein
MFHLVIDEMVKQPPEAYKLEALRSHRPHLQACTFLKRGRHIYCAARAALGKAGASNMFMRSKWHRTNSLVLLDSFLSTDNAILTSEGRKETLQLHRPPLPVALYQ